MKKTDTVFRAYLTNLGKYHEGVLVGEWVDFPTTREEIAGVLKRIGIDGKGYEEYFITDYDSDIYGLSQCLGEYEDLSMLNYLANEITDKICDINNLEAMIAYGVSTGSVEELINLANNEVNFYIMFGVSTDCDIGYYYAELYAEGFCMLEELAPLTDYIDYDRLGRDIRLEEGGMFTGRSAYISMIEDIQIVFDSQTDAIPEEYRVIAL